MMRAFSEAAATQLATDTMLLLARLNSPEHCTLFLEAASR